MKHLFLAIGLLLAVSAKAADRKTFSFTQPLMGTEFVIQIESRDQTAATSAATTAFEEATRLEAIFSDYNPESELLRFCRGELSEPPSPELVEILATAKHLAAASEGAFDPTAGHLSQIWRRSVRQSALPKNETINQALSVTDHQLITLEPLALLKPNVLIDLGGIAKGFTADRMLEHLAAAGFPRSVVAASGDIRIGEPPVGKEGWEIKIAPYGKSGLTETHTLAYTAVSTSGDIHQSVEIDGKHYSHIIDPRLGLGLRRHLAVTVIAPDATTTDSLATTACILLARGKPGLLEKLSADLGVLSLTAWEARDEPEIVFEWQGDGKLKSPTSPLPESLATTLSPFYTQYVDAAGIPIVASANVDPHALTEARHLLLQMLASRTDILANLASEGMRVSIIGHQEFLSTLPENKDLAPARYYDRRFRGLGPRGQRKIVTTAEENLLNFPGDPYRTENNLIHEFAHAVHLYGLGVKRRSFDTRLSKAYHTAIKNGLWADTYAAENSREYWAEGTQSWFHANRENDAIHNHVNTRAEIRTYDPALAQLLEETYGNAPWLYTPATTRQKTTTHLRTYDPTQAPTFSFPPALDAWYRRTYPHLEKNMSRTRE